MAGNPKVFRKTGLDELSISNRERKLAAKKRGSLTYRREYISPTTGEIKTRRGFTSKASKKEWLRKNFPNRAKRRK